MLSVLVCGVLAQVATPERQAETLERRVVASRFRTVGVVTLVGTGIAREVRGVFGALHRWAESRVLVQDPMGPALLNQANDGLLVSWIVTGALAAVTALFFILGFALEP